MKFDQEYIKKWIDLYVQAWRSPGAEMLSKLFTGDVSYKVSPWKVPIKGVDRLRSFWKDARSGPDEPFDLASEIIAVEKNLAVIKIEVNYHDTSESWKDLWIVTFSENGLCEKFEEWPFRKGQDDGQKI